ncbi:sensor histidine kinase [Streptomyces sp. NPDC057638]|uniref:sensor histidine kinase n=1 Tax=Streptomyces sp. NPDC057638 TaxID=3346190 RepID=UPI0036B99DE5
MGSDPLTTAASGPPARIREDQPVSWRAPLTRCSALLCWRAPLTWRSALLWWRRLANERGVMSPALPWLRNDVLLACALAFELVDYAMTGWQAGKPPTVLGALLLTLSVPFLIARRHHPVPVLGTVLVVQLIAGLSADVLHGSSLPFLIALYAVARTGDRRTVLAAGVVAAVVQDIRNAVNGLSAPERLSEILAICFGIAVAIWVRRWRGQVDLNRRLLAERAVAKERRRIARELHDVVAHHITIMCLMSGGARTALGPGQDASREALMTLESSARSALTEMRQLLSVLRSAEPGADVVPGPQPGVEDIGRLVAESRVSGPSAELVVTGAPNPLPMGVSLTLYRIAQEALTNTRKHAGAARAVVRLAYLPDHVTLEITDDGVGHGKRQDHRGARRPTDGGYGLLGMRERVAVHGGSLEAGRRDEGGFRVAVSLPLPLAREPGQPPGNPPAMVG